MASSNFPRRIIKETQHLLSETGANKNPYDEQRLIDEVIYLHALWHQGPQTPSPLPNTLPIPIPAPIPTYNITSRSEPYIPQPLGPYFPGSPRHLHRLHQQPTISPISAHAFAPARTKALPPMSRRAFKKKKKNNNKNKRSEPANNVLQPDPPQSSGLEWPCPGSPKPPATGWTTPKQPPLESLVVSPQEKERLAVLQVQNKACQAFRKFLFDDDDDDNDDEDDDDDHADEWEEFEGFFVRIFMEDDGLRSYYQRCFESGEFCCLVCGAIGKKKFGKKFKGCVGLVQHSMSISRTLKKRAHRAFGQVVCKVLGWDIDRLPTIVMKGEPLGCSMRIKPYEAEVLCANIGANSAIRD